MIVIKRISNVLPFMLVLALAMLVTACGSDDNAATSSADPNNCSSPCIQTAPDLDVTTIQSGTGGTVVMILTIDGDASLVDVSSSTLTLMPVSSVGGQGVLVTGTNGVIDAGASTLTVNFVIPAGSITGEFYPHLIIGIATRPDPNNPGSGIGNNVIYELDTANSSVNYSYSEVVDNESSTFTSNGIPVGTVATSIVIPTVTLQ